LTPRDSAEVRESDPSDIDCHPAYGSSPPYPLEASGERTVLLSLPVNG